MMTMTEKYRAVVAVLQQEREVVARLGNPMDAEQLAGYDRQIESAELGLREHAGLSPEELQYLGESIARHLLVLQEGR